MTTTREISKLEDLAFAAVIKHRFFNFETQASDAWQASSQALLDEKIINLILPTFLQAVIDDDEETIIPLLEECPQLVMAKPNAKLVIESITTGQKFWAEQALLMAVKRKQLNMVKLLLTYCNQLPQTDELIDFKKKCPWNMVLC